MRLMSATFLGLFIVCAPMTVAQARAPRLAVLIVIDQMRADYIDVFGADWTGGLKRLASGGARFVNAAYPYLTTVTCAGHATISTGAFPRTHGIFQNAWFDRKAGAPMTCTEDPKASDLGYNAPVNGGDSAWRLQRPTFADVMRSERGARVVSLSLKDRSAIMLAGHGGDAVTWLSNSLNGWVTSSVFAERAVPAVKAFVDANPIDADFGKTWSKSLPDARYTHRDDEPGEAPPRGWTRTFPHVLNGTSNAPDATYFSQWERSPFANAYVIRFATALADGFALGRRGGSTATDVLAISFSTPDLVGHAFGPRSQELQDVYAQLDRALRELFDHLDATVGKDQWVAALSADHGVTPVPEQLTAEGKDSGRLDARVIGAVADAKLRAAFGEGRYVALSLGNDLYFMPGVYDRIKSSRPVMDGLLQMLGERPGIARVFKSEDLRDPATAKDDLQRAAALSYFPGRSGDLILVPKPGWMFSAAGTTHGTASPDDQKVPLLFYGPGVKSGNYEDASTPADLAPTLAALCGVKLGRTDGRVLTPALAH
jgi:predicted AlkP superfamily pyrophosphatase or phosphodiesterase